MTKISLVVAMASNRVIGHRGTLPWHIPEDLKRFKALTWGKPVIMGRKTWDSPPKEPLPGRTNIVITRNPNFHAASAIVARNFLHAVSLARGTASSEIMVIGGEKIFSAALPFGRTIHLTEIAASPEGDAFMPPIDRLEWRQAARDGPYCADGLSYSFVTLTRDDVVRKPRRTLREMYEDVVREPVPEDFLELLRKIEEARRANDQRS
jgi:dihydrofolate reductase